MKRTIFIYQRIVKIFELSNRTHNLEGGNNNNNNNNEDESDAELEKGGNNNNNNNNEDESDAELEKFRITLIFIVIIIMIISTLKNEVMIFYKIKFKLQDCVFYFQIF
uniref:Candidate secreted effector n=1 Tax=Meloidogyne incognita TaxID=6306 RepID=A0A914NDP5_MELIC